MYLSGRKYLDVNKRHQQLVGHTTNNFASLFTLTISLIESRILNGLMDIRGTLFYLYVLIDTNTIHFDSEKKQKICPTTFYKHLIITISNYIRIEKLFCNYFSYHRQWTHLFCCARWTTFRKEISRKKASAVQMISPLSITSVDSYFIYFDTNSIVLQHIVYAKLLVAMLVVVPKLKNVTLRFFG